MKFNSVEETMTFELKFLSGVIAHLSTSFNIAGLNHYTALAERGSFGMDPAYNYSGNKAWRSDGKPFGLEPVDQFAVEVDDFAQCIMTGMPTKVSGEEGLRDVRILMAAYESARAGKAVSLV